MVRSLLPLIFMILSGVPYILFPQSAPERERKNSISLNVLELAAFEAQITYERALSKRMSLIARGGWKFPVSGGPYRVDGGTFFSIRLDKNFLFTHGYSAALGMNYYLKPEHGFYISAEAFFSDESYEKLFYEYCTGMTKESYVKEQSYSREEYGMKFLVGKKLNLSKRRPQWQADFFGGIGFMHRNEETIVYRRKYDTCDCNSDRDWTVYDPPEASRKEKWLPGMFAGILLTYSF